MRIRAFSKNLEFGELKPYELANCDVVIDGQNYFFDSYFYSGLPFEYGCESDEYAQYLREQLSLFKKANVNCYFVLKGGCGDYDIILENIKNYNDTLCDSSFVLPVFMRESYIEILDEMSFNYTICDFEWKKQCIAIAQRLQCPIISFDIEFCFSGEMYIPVSGNSSSFKYNKTTGSIDCFLFSYTDFIEKYNLNKEKLATFILLTDENLWPENYFQKFFDYIKLNFNNNYCKRNHLLLQWLSKNSNYTFTSILKRCIMPEEYINFVRKNNEVMEFICRVEAPEAPFHYLMQGNRLDFEENDTQWFQKGVACGYVSLPYINLVKYNLLTGSWCIENKEADDAMLLSLDIIKYAFNLLTDYKRTEFQFYDNKNELTTVNVSNAATIPKPGYIALESPFENGWTGIQSKRLFEHFLENSMPMYNFDIFNNVPEDCRLLMIALVYFSHKKSIDTMVEVSSVILSYIMLGVVAEKSYNNCNHDVALFPKPILDPITDKELVTDLDSAAADTALREYLSVSASEVKAIFDSRMLHPLVEFQHCLRQLNFLNKLCGSPYTLTIYSRTYNGTFVYKVAHTIKTNYSGDVTEFTEKQLSPAQTVLAFFNGLKEAYETVMLCTDNV